jgi:hypothetical protein
VIGTIVRIDAADTRTNPHFEAIWKKSNIKWLTPCSDCLVPIADYRLITVDQGT